MSSDDLLRHPSYLDLRQDKKPEASVVEKAVTAIAKAASSTGAITICDRVLFPKSGVTMAALSITTIADGMLLWAANRPISPIRCPKAAKKCFFQKHDAGSFGHKVKHAAIREKNGGTEPYLLHRRRRAPSKVVVSLR